jgi:hypothetical protein
MNTRLKYSFADFISSCLMIIVMLIGLMMTGCSKNPTEVEDYDPEPILTAFIYNGEPIQEVYLNWTAPVDAVFLLDYYFISGAEIKIFPLGDPSAGDTLHFVERNNPDRGWMYVPAPNESLTPQGKVKYRIEARIPSGNIFMWAETMVPDTFTLRVSPYIVELDTIRIPLDWNDEPIHLDWTEADSSAGIICSSVALEGHIALPLDPDAEDPEDHGVQNIEILNLSAAGIDIPWLNFYWAGWHWMQVQFVGADCVDYMMSLFNEQVSDPLFNMHGGLGIFSGVSRQSFYVQLQRVQ